MVTNQKNADTCIEGGQPQWYKDAIIYELHVRGFCDSNADGIGDFNGLISKLDYLQDLGVTALWLLPFYPSPLRDDGYDIADYTAVHPDYGTMADFKRFLAEAHRRDLRVITELAINHTSNEHAWFQRARNAPPGSRYRDFYVWSDTPERFRDARIIFEDFETSNWAWDPVAGAYYWHRFYSHQPDLNFDNPLVQKAVFKVVDFWNELGVDGMRLDAVPYLFEREGTNCENLPETHDFLKRLRAHVDAKFEDRMLLAEANQWPDDAAAYFGAGDECHMNFHFPVMPRLFMSVQLENRFPIVDILQQTPDIPDTCQWALFLRNHDELTLEMVTDEDRDYMYRTYAEDPQMRVNVGIRRRLAPLLRQRRKAELMNGLLMSLPGTPVIYYGDEIGQGDNVYLGDRNGVRTPMQWSGDRNAGFSRANPQKLYLPVITDPEYHYEALNVEAQQGNTESLLWWMKRLIAQRKQHPVLGRAGVQFLEPDNPKVLCFIRADEHDCLLVVANLSRHMQYVELDLSEYEGRIPVELAGGTHFPPVSDRPYLLSLAGYQFVWFDLRAEATPGALEQASLPRVAVPNAEALFRSPLPTGLARSLQSFLIERRWFRSKAKAIKAVTFCDRLPLGGTPGLCLAIVKVDYDADLPEHYLLALDVAEGEQVDQLLTERPDSVVAQLVIGASMTPALLYDPTGEDLLSERLLGLFARRRPVNGSGVLLAEPERALRTRLAADTAELTPSVPSLEQSNTVIFYGSELVLKLFRQVDSGLNPDVEVGKVLSKHGFAHTADVLGTLRYDGEGFQEASLGIVQKLVPGTQTLWDITLQALDRAFDEAMTLPIDVEPPPLPSGGVLSAAKEPIPELLLPVIGSYLPLVRSLGERTAELHLTLAAEVTDPAFRPEPFAGHYARSMVQAARDKLVRVFKLLGSRLNTLAEPTRELAQDVLGRQSQLLDELSAILQAKLEVHRIRCHGDYHLGQVLFDGRDVTIIDFEGEPAVSIGVRRLKRSALTDVCGMLRSFDYAVTRALESDTLRPEDRLRLAGWARAWAAWVGAAFVGSYMERAGKAQFLPDDEHASHTLIQLHLIDKCAYELSYELNNRPDWVSVPLRGLLSLSSSAT